MVKKKKNEVTLTEAFRYFFAENGLEQRVLDSMVIDAWHDQMGDFLKKYTENLYVKNQKLFVKLNNPSLKNELSFGKSKILQHINQHVGKEYITDVVFL